MATAKTFKIGLSATDKQNMAQDVYERILDLTFPEYDTTASYSVGDFVVYNNQLYKCIGATSGTWDATKWQLATLNDLVEDIENAVAFVNDKANVDGNYPTLTAGLADNLTPYSEDSGASQEQPFISQGTGCGNGTEIVTTGDYALLREKQGNTLVVNQLVQTSAITKDNIGGIAVSANDEEITFNGTWDGTTNIGNTWVSLDYSFKANHKYLVIVEKISGSISGTANYVELGTANDIGAWATIYGTSSDTPIGSNNSAITGSLLRFRSVGLDTNSPLSFTNYKFKYRVIDLTQMFGSNDNIPADLLSHPENFFRYYNGSLAYNTGTLVNANSERLVSTKRNLWDEETQIGSYNTTTGVYSSGGSNICSKNAIKVIPNTKYCFKKPRTQAFILFYDKDDNCIPYIAKTGDTASVYNSSAQCGTGSDYYLFTTPANCAYIQLIFDWTTYENNVTISLYYTPEQGGEGYDQYYPYEEPYVVDTGSEVLRQAGSAKDYKTPDGVVHRVIGSYTFTGSESWNASGDAHYTNVSAIRDYVKKPASNGDVSNILSPIGIPASPNNMYTATKTDGIGISVNGELWVGSGTYANISSLTGKTIYFELATPTTEQGTTFSENLPINDYGMLYWQESNGVPQGVEIFYPVNYKGFLDDLYSRVSGDSSDYALNSELNSKFETYLKSLSGYDATKTQTLKNVNGTLTWVDD